jgi:hypothetical protein
VNSTTRVPPWFGIGQLAVAYMAFAHHQCARSPSRQTATPRRSPFDRPPLVFTAATHMHSPLSGAQPRQSSILLSSTRFSHPAAEPRCAAPLHRAPYRRRVTADKLASSSRTRRPSSLSRAVPPHEAKVSPVSAPPPLSTSTWMVLSVLGQAPSTLPRAPRQHHIAPRPDVCRR